MQGRRADWEGTLDILPKRPPREDRRYGWYARSNACGFLAEDRELEEGEWARQKLFPKAMGTPRGVGGGGALVQSGLGWAAMTLHAWTGFPELELMHVSYFVILSAPISSIERPTWNSDDER